MSLTPIEPQPDDIDKSLGEWWVCEHPERPHDDWASYHPPALLCRGCVIAAEAALWAGVNIGRYLDVVGEVEADTGKLAVPERAFL